MGELIFIGMGIYDEKDISVKGKEELKRADAVYCEFYTSSLAGSDISKIEREYGVDIEVLTRDQVEREEIPLIRAQEKKVVFLTAGDPMAATTHVDLRLRARTRGIDTWLIHSSSIFSAVASLLGVQHYKFGKTIALPFAGEREYPASPYHGIKQNMEMGLHTLVLLDINGEEQKYMTVNQGAKVLMELEERLGEGVITGETVLAGLARVGSRKPELKVGYPNDLLEHDFGAGLHCMVVFGELHFMEIDSLIALAGAPESIAYQE
ncbi:MAG: diphthine synthase [Thermoplasmata archaeon]